MSQALDYVDLQVCILALGRYRRETADRWVLLDRLHGERACLKTDIARQLYKGGRLDDRGWDRVCREIDELLNGYDDQSLYRHEVLRLIDDIVVRLRFAVRADQDSRKGGLNVA